MFLLAILLAGTLLWLLAQWGVRSLYFTRRFYLLGAIVALGFLLAYSLPFLEPLAYVLFWLFAALLALDGCFVFAPRQKPAAARHMADRMSNGDKNPVSLTIKNPYPFTVTMEIIDELPFQFQERNHSFYARIPAAGEIILRYELRPVERGEYHFGDILLYTGSLLGLVKKRFACAAQAVIPVYPSFVQLRRHELAAQLAHTSESGSKRMRKIGHSMEFEQIREYAVGDDIRNINWKATARKTAMMVNSYTEERSQQVYCLIDKGRLMKMPFDHLSLLDYAINAALMLCHVCLYRQDRFGLLTFSHAMGSFLQAERHRGQLENVLKALYSQQTGFLETDFEMLYTAVRTHIRQRSLLLLFTNFESLAGLQRQMPYLQQIARHHLLVVIFFENTELQQLTATKAGDLEAVYLHTIAEKFVHEKRVIVKELQKQGIFCLLTPPQQVTVNALNKYLELKAREAM